MGFDNSYSVVMLDRVDSFGDLTGTSLHQNI